MGSRCSTTIFDQKMTHNKICKRGRVVLQLWEERRHWHPRKAGQKNKDKELG